MQLENCLRHGGDVGVLGAECPEGASEVNHVVPIGATWPARPGDLAGDERQWRVSEEAWVAGGCSSKGDDSMGFSGVSTIVAPPGRRASSAVALPLQTEPSVL